MPSFDNLNYKDTDVRQEIAAIYTIVSRNFQADNWLHLSPEAQTQMVAEANTLLQSQLLSFNQKQRLLSLVTPKVPVSSNLRNKAT
jgi:hypothetical protein